MSCPAHHPHCEASFSGALAFFLLVLLVSAVDLLLVPVSRLLAAARWLGERRRLW